MTDGGELPREYLGETGVRVSPLALGTWRFGTAPGEEPDFTEQEAYDLLDAYAETGGNFLDTADRYGGGLSEEWIGNWLADRDRGEFVVASKTGRPTLERENLSRPYVRRQVDGILDRLDTDYLDVLYVHRWDDDTATAGGMRTLDELVSERRVHHFGISCGEPDAWKVARANEIADRKGFEPFTVAQPRYSLVVRGVERNYLEMARHYGVAVCPFSPLGEGFLTGKYDRDDRPPAGSRADREGRVAEWYFSPDHFDVLDEVRAVAEELGATPAQVSLAWLLDHPDVTAPVIGVRTIEQLSENAAAVDLSLSQSQFDRLAAAMDPPTDI